MDPVLRRLDDENEIRKLVIGFSLGMDARDYTMFRAAWADEVDLDLPPLARDTVPFSGVQQADDYARGVIAMLSEFVATQHVSANHLIEVDGDTATCTCYTLAQHYLPVASGDPWLTAGARYDLAARRFDIGWRFVRFKLTGLWTAGNGSLWRVVAGRLAAKRKG
jgi:hypothetical protein